MYHKHHFKEQVQDHKCVINKQVEITKTLSIHISKTHIHRHAAFINGIHAHILTYMRDYDTHLSETKPN